MTQNKQLRLTVDGYGVIGKRVADAVAFQDDMVLKEPLTLEHVNRACSAIGARRRGSILFIAT